MYIFQMPIHIGEDIPHPSFQPHFPSTGRKLQHDIHLQQHTLAGQHDHVVKTLLQSKERADNYAIVTDIRCTIPSFGHLYMTNPLSMS